MRDLGKKFSSKKVADARAFALQPMLDVAKSHLISNRSVHRGVLLNGMVIAQKSKNVTVITATGKAIGLAHLVEFGTAPHWQPKRGRQHPGARPKPFLRPAFEEMRSDVPARFGEALVGMISGLR